MSLSVITAISNQSDLVWFANWLLLVNNITNDNYQCGCPHDNEGRLIIPRLCLYLFLYLYLHSMWFVFVFEFLLYLWAVGWQCGPGNAPWVQWRRRETSSQAAAEQLWDSRYSATVQIKIQCKYKYSTMQIQIQSHAKSNTFDSIQYELNKINACHCEISSNTAAEN